MNTPDVVVMASVVVVLGWVVVLSVVVVLDWVVVLGWVVDTSVAIFMNRSFKSSQIIQV